MISMVCGAQAMMETAEKVAGASPRIAVFDRKRKIELALKLQQRWQRWELTNFDYLMQVRAITPPCLPHSESSVETPPKNDDY